MNNYLARNDTSNQPDSIYYTHRRAVDRVNPMAPAEREISFREMWRVLHKRRLTFGLCTLCTLTLAALITFAFKPKYRSTAVVQVNKESTDALGVDELTGRRSDEAALGFMVTLETHAAALQSDALALQVVRELDLESRPEFRSKQFWSDYFMRFMDDSKMPLEEAPHRRAEVLKAFHKNLRVNTEPGTRLIKVQFYNPDPTVSAQVINTLVNDYIERNFQIRYAATKQASGWLSEQLADLKNQVEMSQQRMVDYEREAGIFGTDESHNIVMTHLEDISKQLTDAESNRILAQAVWQLAQAGSPELVSGLVGNSTTMTSPTTMTMTLTLIQTLRSQEAQLKADYAQASTKYGSAYPRLIQMQNQIKDLDGSIKAQVENLAARAENDYQAALQTENGLHASFEQAKGEANKMNDSAVQYTIMKHEAESSRDLYDGLLKKFQEAGVIASLRSTNILLWDPATPTDRPARPIVPLNLAIGLFGGLLLGGAGAFFRENLDQTIDTVDQLESAALGSSLAVVPKWRAIKPSLLKPAKGLNPASNGILMLSQPQSHAAEAYRTLRACILEMDPTTMPKVILVTSATREEGKTTTSLNCAVALAQQGPRVLLVEADLRRPALKTRLNLSATHGLSSMLGGAPPTGLPVSIPSVPNLSVIPAGPESPSPAEMIGSPSMTQLVEKWRAEYDFVVVDTPPVLSASETLVLSAHCDAVIVVVRSGVTTKHSIARLRNLFLRTRAAITGVVMNAIDPRSPENRAYYRRDLAA
ncbi:MAG: polysaccharide biosynthesis tyrosine autokinase [Terriglobia bacterium]|jgi:capsular exopolysaccharide synthesis family protein